LIKGEKMKKFLERSKGFTLVELMVVIAIIGILAVVALGIVRGAQQRAKDATLKATASNISTALEAYYSINMEYPETLDILWTSDVLDGEITLPTPCEYNGGDDCGIDYDRPDTEGYQITVRYIADTDNLVFTGGRYE
jgi:prepilin-type N-terminal cleavage/methylation domain-containing protein